MRAVRLGIFVALGLGLAGCTSGKDFWVEKRTSGNSDQLITDAAARVITTTPIARTDSVGRFAPEQVTCAEPSPDVAKAIETAFSAGVSINITGEGAELPAEAQAKIAGAIAQARSEALAQLTERLPTIQLLRDGMFRACEAYANGALSPISYALVLSRYADTMITMLGGELIAGDFGRELGSISGEATSKSSSSLDSSGESSDLTKRLLEQSGDELAQKTDEVGEAAVAASDPDATAEDKAELQRKLDEQHEAKRKFQDILKADAEATTKATAKAGAALTAQPITAHQAQLIAQMDQNFIRTPSPGALLVACITALDRAPESATAGASAFATQCGGPDGLLTQTALLIASQVASQNAIDSETEALPYIEQTILRAAQAKALVNSILADPSAAPLAGTPGDLAAQIMKVQTALKDKGLYAGAIDGLAGPETVLAIRAFQAQAGLPQTGLLDGTTMAKLLPAG